jgi:hypothetical protein
MEFSWKQQSTFTNANQDSQEFKRMMMDTNPYLLGRRSSNRDRLGAKESDDDG